MTVLPVVLLSVALAAAPQASDRRAEADRLLRAGSYAEALKLYQGLAAANPDDISARMSIADVHTRMGHEERAIDVYRSIVAVEPTNGEALMGLGLALTALGELQDAADALNRAEAIAADRPAVLAAQGRLHARAGHTQLALAYYERALAIEAGNDAVRQEYLALKASRAHRVTATYYFEDFNTSDPNTHAGAIEVNGRVNDGLRLYGAGEHLRKFDRDEDRGGGGIEWNARHDLRLTGGVLIGNDTLVLPDADVSIDLQHPHRQVEWLIGYRYLHFDDSSSWVLSPGLLARHDRTALLLRYHHSRTTFRSDLDPDGNDGFTARLTHTFEPRLTLGLRYVYGFEGLDFIHADRLSQSDANTVAGIFEYSFQPMTSIAARYEHQFRSAGIRVATVFATFTQRF